MAAIYRLLPRRFATSSLTEIPVPLFSYIGNKTPSPGERCKFSNEERGRGRAGDDIKVRTMADFDLEIGVTGWDRGLPRLRFSMS